MIESIVSWWFKRFYVLYRCERCRPSSPSLFSYSSIFLRSFKISRSHRIHVSLASSCPAHFILIIFDPTEALTNQAPKTTKNAFGCSKAEMGICCMCTEQTSAGRIGGYLDTFRYLQAQSLAQRELCSFSGLGSSWDNIAVTLLTLSVWFFDFAHWVSSLILCCLDLPNAAR